MKFNIFEIYCDPPTKLPAPTKRMFLRMVINGLIF